MSFAAIALVLAVTSANGAAATPSDVKRPLVRSQPSADDSIRPNYAVGDAFIWSNGRIEKVRRIQGDQIVWSGVTGGSWRRSINFVAPIPEWRFEGQIGRRTVLGDIDALWPLRKGATVKFRVISESRRQSDPGETWNRSVALWTCQVGANRTVTVEAGSFSTSPIVCDRFSNQLMRPLERIVWDFSPDVGHFVRRTTTDYRDGRQVTVRLVAALHGPSASEDRLVALARPYRPKSTTE